MQKTTICTSSENLTKSTEIAAFWQGSFYSCPAWVAKCDRIWYNITIKIKKAVENRTEKKRVPASAWHEVASRSTYYSSTYYSFISKKKRGLIYRQKTDRQDIIINKQASGARRLLPTRADRKTRQLMQKRTD